MFPLLCVILHEPTEELLGTNIHINNAICIICLEDFWSSDWCSTRGKCNHIFHFYCIEEWIKLEKNLSELSIFDAFLKISIYTRMFFYSTFFGTYLINIELFTHTKKHHRLRLRDINRAASFQINIARLKNQRKNHIDNPIFPDP